MSIAQIGDADMRACVLEFLRADGLGARLAAEARERYADSGRGLWVAALRVGSAETECNWVCSDECAVMILQGKIPPVEVKDLTRQVCTYDPDSQFVLYTMHPDGTTRSYVMNSRPDGAVLS
jgi:hypothetical protein